VDRAPADDLRERLVPWFRATARDLPWRRDPRPYPVLLSELMLQQTRVETVIPYFERFLARWPTVEALAAASDEEVLQAWAGLGYYRRARALLAAARAAVAAGGIPSHPDGLAALPGVGPYTAGAVASIAFGLPAPAVDGNVERVISRVDARDEDPRSRTGRAAIVDRVRAIHAPGVASEVTQGLMELGATICTPRSPRCGACPWADACVGRATGIAAELPRLPPRKAPVDVRGVAGILVREGRVLVGRRPPGLLGGLWEPVGAELGADEDAPSALGAAFARRAGLRVEVGPRLGQVVHVFTHRRLTLDVHAVAGAGEPGSDGSYEALAWLDPARPELALSKLAVRALALTPARSGTGSRQVLRLGEEAP
jgi:A/G-specific adenine glycosylase